MLHTHTKNSTSPRQTSLIVARRSPRRCSCRYRGVAKSLVTTVSTITTRPSWCLMKSHRTRYTARALPSTKQYRTSTKNRSRNKFYSFPRAPFSSLIIRDQTQRSRFQFLKELGVSMRPESDITARRCAVISHRVGVL